MINKKTMIIAEAGVNHNGEITTAKDLIRAASEAGADYVKFQTFNADDLVVKGASLANYQTKAVNYADQRTMLKTLELKYSWHEELCDFANANSIGFLTTPFDLKSLEFVSKLNLDLLKIPSGEITNFPLLAKMGSLCKPIVLSTGMSNLGEIEAALRVLTTNGAKKSAITILHCTSEYPAPMCDVNLAAMITLRQCFEVEVGFSDHTLGTSIPIAAVALGATVIEKHFTLNKAFKGPDHSSSLDPNELKHMVKSIREVEVALGSAQKIVSPSEIANRNIVRKSIVASCDIQKGDAFTVNNLTTKRPGTGISPTRMDDIIGEKSSHYFKKDELIKI